MLDRQFQVLFAGICLVSINFSHREVTSSCLHQWLKLWRVMGIASRDLNTCHNIGFHPTHQMHLHPIMVILLMSIASIVPTNIAGGAKTRRVHSKVYIDCLEAKATFSNEVT